MYIWDYDKATEAMKPQVSCFTLISSPPPPTPTPGDGEIALVDQCTDL